MWDDLTPYEEGYLHGFNDEQADCPYEENTDAYEEWWQGYIAGCDDC